MICHNNSNIIELVALKKSSRFAKMFFTDLKKIQITKYLKENKIYKKQKTSAHR